jgi:hypothetical protein
MEENLEVTIRRAQKLSIGNAHGTKDAFRELRIDPPRAAPFEVIDARNICLTGELERLVRYGLSS